MKMNKMMSVAVCLAFLGVVKADTFYDGSRTWTYTVSSGNATLTAGTYLVGEIKIPSKVKTYNVVALGADLFSGATSIKSVIIPNGVATIGRNCFSGCSNLKTITIPPSVMTIGWEAFNNCSSMEKVNISDIANWCGIEFSGESANPLRYAHRLFLDDSEVLDLTIPEGVAKVKNYAFYGCYSIRSLTVPSTVQWVGYEAFDFCENLCHVNICDGVGSISDYAFAYSGNLSDVILPADDITIGSYAFYHCNVKKLTVPRNIKKLVDVIPDVCETVTNLIVGSKTEIIGDDAFSSCGNLSFVTIPSSVTNISSSAFVGCGKIKSVQIPQCVLDKTIRSAFPNSYSLIESVVINSGVRYVGEDAFRGCSSVSSVTFPFGLESILSRAFEGCESLTALHFPSSLQRIAMSAFVGCTHIDSVYAADLLSWCNVIFEGPLNSDRNQSFFVGGQRIVDLKLPEGLKCVHSYAFANFDIKSLEVPRSVERIDTASFSGCAELESVTVIDGKRLTYIGEGAFSGCGSIVNFQFPVGLTYIGESAFSGCWNLQDVVIPEGVEKILPGTFRGCSNMKSVNLPLSVESVDRTAFLGCRKIDSVALPGHLTNLAKTFPDSTRITSVVVSEGSSSVIDFSNCSSLRNVSLPASVTNVQSGAFHGCSKVVSITVPGEAMPVSRMFADSYKSVEEISIARGSTLIADNLCKGCSNAVSVVIPDGVVTIGQNAFSGCGRLEDVNMPTSVIYISDGAFENCFRLGRGVIEIDGCILWANWADDPGPSSVIISQGVRLIAGGAFANSSNLKEIIVPESVVSIGPGAFKGCRQLGSFSFPAGIKAIEWESFADCVGLKEVTIPEGVCSIGAYAFNGCSNLTKLSIPQSVQRIRAGAFNGCKGLGSGVVIVDNCALVVNGDCPSKVDLQSGVRLLADSLFTDCTGVKSVKLFEGLTEIPESAFSGCDSIESVLIPESVTNIGSYAFYRCSSLKSVNIPSAVRSIGEQAFNGCKLLSMVSIENLRSWCGINFSSYTSNPLYYAKKFYISGLVVSDVEIPGDVKTISRYAFYGCSGIHSVEISEGVTRIGEKAFCKCTGLSSVAIPQSLICVEAGAFEECSGLRSVNIQDLGTWCKIEFGSSSANPLGTARKMFLKGQEITNLIIPDGTETVNRFAFYCGEFNSVTIPPSLKCVRAAAFGECRIDNVYITDLAAWCGIEFFSETSNPLSCKYERYARWDEIESCRLFVNGCEVVDVIIPTGVKTISDFAFFGYRNLRSVVLPDGVQRVGNWAFYGCGLGGILKIPLTVKSIGRSAFCSCGYFSELIIHTGIEYPVETSIDAAVFTDCEFDRVVIRLQEGDDGQDVIRRLTADRVADSYQVIKISPPAISPVDGTVFEDAIKVTITSDVEGAVIRYTVDGTVPTGESPVFKKCTVLHKTTIKAMSEIDGYCSCVATASYAKGRIDPPVITTSTEGLPVGVRVAIGCDTEGVDIYYTTNGADPSVSGILYAGEFVIDESAEIKAVAMNHSEYFDSAISTEIVEVEKPVAPSPICSMPDGYSFYSNGELVALSSSTEGELILFTLDGSDPRSNGLQYFEPIIVDETTTIRMIGRLAGYADSDEVVVRMVRKWLEPHIIATTAREGSGLTTTTIEGPGLWVRMDYEIGGGVIRYTCDGTDPTPESSSFDAPFFVSKAMTIKAAVFKNGVLDSGVAMIHIVKKWTVGDSLNAPELVFSYDGDVAWQKDEDVSIDGVASMRSGTIGDDEQSILQTTVTGPGIISFYWKASCEKTDLEPYWWDYGAFLVDDVEVEWVDGETDWVRCDVCVTGGGDHVLSWKYEKDYSDFSGMDCLWLDAVTWSPSGCLIDISDFDVEIDPIEFVYSGQDCVPDVSVAFQGKPLICGQDYNLSFHDNLHVGRASVVVSGCGCFKGELTRGYSIMPAPLTITANSKVQWLGDPELDLTYSVEGLLGSDVLTGELSREAGSGIGSYAIKQGSLMHADYDIAFVEACYEIKENPLCERIREANSSGGDVIVEPGMSLPKVAIRSGTRILVKPKSGECLNIEALRNVVSAIPTEAGQNADCFKVVAAVEADGTAIIHVELDKDVVKADETLATVLTRAWMDEFQSIEPGVCGTVAFKNVREGLYYGLGVSGEVGDVLSSLERVTFVRAAGTGVTLPIVRPIGDSAFFKMWVRDRPGESVANNKQYMVIDLVGGPDAVAYPVKYIESIPDDLEEWPTEFKTTKLVCRRIASEMSGFAFEYWIGVFEITQKQYELVMGEIPVTEFSGVDGRPVTGMTYEKIVSGPLSFCGLLSLKTGVNFGLPDEEMWQVSCRAGASSDSDLATHARYSANRHDGAGGYDDVAIVGSYLPNGWGLYDMLGNVWEWVSTVYSPGGYHMRCGGSFETSASRTSSTYRDYSYTNPNYYLHLFGFRVCARED